MTQFSHEHQVEGEQNATDVPQGERKDNIVEAVVEISVPDDGDEEHEVEEDDGGGGGRVSAHPHPLHAPGPVVMLSWVSRRHS